MTAEDELRREMMRMAGDVAMQRSLLKAGDDFFQAVLAAFARHRGPGDKVDVEALLAEVDAAVRRYAPADTQIRKILAQE